MADLPVVLILAPAPLHLQSPPAPQYETRELDCRWYASDDDLGAILAHERPDVIASFGDRTTYQNLLHAPDQVKRRWLHFDTAVPAGAELARAGALVFCYFLRHALAPLGRRDGQNAPLVSVFTPAFRPGTRAHRAFRSLLDQTYANWEWVVVDDSDDVGVTWQMLTALARTDPRMSVHTSDRHSGRIGETKRRACTLSRGDILVEFDHDDELTPDALSEIVGTFQRHPRTGFVYSDWAEVAEDGGASLTYGDGWAFGQGSYRAEHDRGRTLRVANAPPINATTIRHIASAPNHVRAWRRDLYWQIGGHNPNLHVADDYELVVRTFLQTEMRHIPKLCYIQYLNSGSNTQDRRRGEIQRLVRAIQQHYDRQIHRRLQQLGWPDPAWPERARSPGPSVRPSRLIVSFTTLPSRIHRIGPMVDSIANQTMTPDEVRIYVPRTSAREGQTYDVPSWLIDRGLTVVRCDRDWGPATKLMPCLIDGGRPDDIIITVDDDIAYEPHLIEDLVAASSTHPDSVLCMMGVDRHQQFIHAEHISSPVEVAVVGGYRGVLYRRRFFNVEALQREYTATVTGDVHLADDHLLSAHVKSRGTKLLVIAPGRAFRFLNLGNGVFGSENAAAAGAAAAAVRAHYEKSDRELSVVVLDATATDLTTACLESIRRCCPCAEIVLVANGVESKARRLADVYVAVEGNIGFAAGSNLGAAHATRPHLCFMNDDAVFVDAETPLKLLAAAREGAIAGPYANRAKPPQGDVLREDVPTEDRPVDAVVGLCLAIQRTLFDRLGGFDARFLTWEDDDLCARARKLSVPIRVVGGAWVAHERHASFSTLGLDVHAIMGTARRRFERAHPPLLVTAVAKAEEDAVSGYFTQFRDLMGEGFLLDTGSTDRTVELAEMAGARVARHAGIESSGFAAARNVAAALACADRQDPWIVMLDPDERLDAETVAAIPELIASAGDRFDVFLAPLDAVYPDGSRRAFVPKPFLYRYGASHWRYLVHEKLVGGRHALVENARIEHQIALHSKERRQQAEGLYQRLMTREPYFTDRLYRADERETWPILDHERADDSRIQKIQAGPLVSVIVPTYDRPELCARAVESALMQDWVSVDVIVVADACPRFDAVRRIGECDPRVRHINLPSHHGAGGAIPRNVGVLAAAGDWIAYLDDDCAWDGDHVSSVMAAIRDAGASWGFSSMRVFGGTDLGFTAPARGQIDTSCIVHAKRLLRDYGPWRSIEELHDYAHDWEIVSRWVAGGEPWAATRKPTLNYGTETSGQAAFLRSLVHARNGGV